MMYIQSRLPMQLPPICCKLQFDRDRCIYNQKSEKRLTSGQSMIPPDPESSDVDASPVAAAFFTITAFLCCEENKETALSAIDCSLLFKLHCTAICDRLLFDTFFFTTIGFAMEDCVIEIILVLEFALFLGLLRCGCAFRTFFKRRMRGCA